MSFQSYLGTSVITSTKRFRAYRASVSGLKGKSRILVCPSGLSRTTNIGKCFTTPFKPRAMSQAISKVIFGSIEFPKALAKVVAEAAAAPAWAMPVARKVIVGNAGKRAGLQNGYCSNNS
jgi:hypothetical protein